MAKFEKLAIDEELRKDYISVKHASYMNFLGANQFKRNLNKMMEKVGDAVFITSVKDETSSVSFANDCSDILTFQTFEIY